MKPKPQAWSYSSALWIVLAQSGGCQCLFPGHSPSFSYSVSRSLGRLRLRFSVSYIKFLPLTLLFYFGLLFIFSAFWIWMFPITLRSKAFSLTLKKECYFHPLNLTWAPLGFHRRAERATHASWAAPPPCHRPFVLTAHLSVVISSGFYIL